jgi:hypothetical protein
MERLESCCLCGAEVLERDLRRLYRQVIAFEPQPAKGRLRMKRRTGLVAHAECVERAERAMKAGASPYQAGLFDEERM